MRVPFESSVPGTFGLTLQLQLISPSGWELAPKASEVIASLDPSSAVARRIRPAASQECLEISSSEHEHPAGLTAQMQEIQSELLAAASASSVYLSGGGTHPYTRSHLDDSQVLPGGLGGSTGFNPDTRAPYAARVHLGVQCGDEAVDLIRRLSPYVPHLIAISAASPYLDGQDTGLACARLHNGVAGARQTSLPATVRDWTGFEGYLAARLERGLPGLESLVWDLCPVPEQGVVTFNVIDSPLTLQKACELTAFVRVLHEWALRQDRTPEQCPSTYAVNRYHACLSGLAAGYVNTQGQRTSLRQDLLRLLEKLAPVADELGAHEQIASLQQQVLEQADDAGWLRSRLEDNPQDWVRAMVERFSATQISEDPRQAIEARRAAGPGGQTDRHLQSLLVNSVSSRVPFVRFQGQV